MAKVRSKKQAGLFGLKAGGKSTRKAKTLTRAKAKEALRGVKVKSLPTRVAKKKSTKKGRKRG